MESSRQGVGKMGFLRGLSLVTALSLLLLPVQEVSAHGALGFPLARQYGCKIDGGYYWPPDGSKIPNEGCRNAYLAGDKSYYPFNQWNEVSANPTDPSDFATVMKAVPDGLLCAGGDQRKRGLDIPQDEGWRKTVIEPKNGTFQLRWENSRSHNPAIMRVYITKPSYDPSKNLTWEDLDKIYEEPAPNPVPANGTGLIPEVTSFYYLDVPVGDRTGDAIIYGYWQRIDAGDEGFFNCADVTLKKEGAAGTSTKSGTEKDDHRSDTQWVEDQLYLERDLVPDVGDKVRFRLMNEKNRGRTAVDVTLPITTANVRNAKWSKDLANTLNKKYKSQVKIGVQSGKSIKYNLRNVYANRVWLKPGYSSAITVIKGDQSNTH
ncbi:hypothetical protein EC973_006142 [Apophysomyces ossiformis]|uniref:Chitin-binding protein n=1 Tax=Apophysomyces ossiformis TaxID=679940 RepID=A0A8H7BNP2_9FUNG|nr:hypothetical protein EC973_006142 [Apophysomyces ossiformis]